MALSAGANASLRAAAERVSAPILVPLVVVVCLLTLTFTAGVSWVVERENAARIGRTMRQVTDLFGLEVAEDGAHGHDHGDPKHAWKPHEHQHGEDALPDHDHPH